MQAQIQVIRCPHCKEYIDARSAHCRFCRGYIDTLTTQVSAELQERVNAAYNDGLTVRNTAGVCLILAVIQLVKPLLGLFTEIALLCVFVAVPVMLVKWQLRFGQLQTDDPDYPQAKKNRRVALFIWLCVPIVYLLPELLLYRL
jgi:hypothetical protein